ncbi:MAG: HEPN domain-containing protein [Gammaproteobacteria bacterium]|jgi:HEPN domain-containing protein|nr:HEPN domain-containing protein [Gammaproteobacteria bacterium]MBT6878216.1 HEPN domain-containing protein [Gammaproteobacteria bacterium]HIJ23508.1 HEPN domain-containing protein [Gammaproteobacteria bacterium]
MEFMKQYRVLVIKAKADLKAGKNLLEDIEQGDEELDIGVVMFHLQQSAEKLLKALLSYHQHHYTKTHSIRELIGAVQRYNIAMPEQSEQLIPLSYYAVEGRYAVIHDDMEDVDKYILRLDELVHFINEMISLSE